MTTRPPTSGNHGDRTIPNPKNHQINPNGLTTPNQLTMTTLLMNPPNHSQHFPPITHPHTATSRTNRRNRGMNNPLLQSTSLQDTCMATTLQEGSKGEWFRGVNFALRHPDRMRAANEVDHLARAIMHLNYLAGLCHSLNHPLNGMIQRSITSSELGAQTMRPEASTPSSPYQHHLVHPRWCHMEASRHTWLNPEQNLRPLTVARYPREVDEQNPNLDTTTRNPVPTVPPETIPAPDLPRATTRITTPVPVRSK